MTILCKLEGVPQMCGIVTVHDLQAFLSPDWYPDPLRRLLSTSMSTLGSTGNKIIITILASSVGALVPGSVLRT